MTGRNSEETGSPITCGIRDSRFNVYEGIQRRERKGTGVLGLKRYGGGFMDHVYEVGTPCRLQMSFLSVQL